MVNIGLEIIDILEEVIIKALLDSKATRLVMSSKFARKQEFKFKTNKKTNIYKKYRQLI